MRRSAAWILAGGVAATALTVGTGPAQARDCGTAGTSAAYRCAEPGDLIDVTLGELHPTQSVLGYDEVYYKLGRYRSDKDAAAGGFNKRFDDWCEANGQGETATAQPQARLDDPSSFTCTTPVGEETPETVAPMKTAVIGPGGALYLTDGHHTLSSFLESPDGGASLHVRLRVTDNFSRLSTAEFWKTMEAQKKVWLRDEKDRPITVGQLPDRLGLANFHDDPYRSLVYFTRDIGYATPNDPSEFLEYYWGEWLRGSVDLGTSDLTAFPGYLDLVKKTSRAMVALDAQDPVAGGKTAADLGKLAEWNAGKKETSGEFAKLSKPITDPKPGKLAYALDFKADVPSTPACTTTVTGTRSGPLTVDKGVTCLDRALVNGPVTVRAGASLVSNGSTLKGPLSAVGARTLQLCGTRVNGPVSVTASTGPVRLGGIGCTANTLAAPVALVGNGGGVQLSGNTIGGPLACVGNQPAPVDAGRPNQVRSVKSGQCTAL
ncbi:ParB/Srx family N-terminal domain-containing protein [Streptomyces sp. NPDC058001]|uniref:ParB/Srx family N-terminal domain-containing protein n=1 Tax=Streptomyces sp. NPDC058001 TaxID=3346300 RepID=UPI0036E4C6BC